MDERLRVEPAALHAVGHDLHAAADDSTKAFTRNHARVSAAADGLFSGAQRALQEKAEQWRPAAAAIVASGHDHGSNLQTSAALYTSTDGHTSDALYVAGENASPPLNLDV